MVNWKLCKYSETAVTSPHPIPKMVTLNTIRVSFLIFIIQKMWWIFISDEYWHPKSSTLAASATLLLYGKQQCSRLYKPFIFEIKLNGNTGVMSKKFIAQEQCVVCGLVHLLANFESTVVTLPQAQNTGFFRVGKRRRILVILLYIAVTQCVNVGAVMFLIISNMEWCFDHLSKSFLYLVSIVVSIS